MTTRLPAVLAAALILGASTAHAQIIGNNPAPTAPATKSTSSGGGGGASAPKQSLDGRWSYQSPCTNGTVYVGELGFSGSSGTFRGDVSGINGTINDAIVNGRDVSFVVQYKLMGTTREFWSGKLSSDGASMSGTIPDTWSGDCTFTARRL